MRICSVPQKFNMEGVAEIKLSSGHRMPVLGMGTAAFPVAPQELVESAILRAIELGYRHFDTASVYQTEATLGRAISAALKQGLIASRDQLFITTKLWCGDADRHLVVPALQESLQALGLEYVDLYLIHFPAKFKRREKFFSVTKDDVLPLDMEGTWKGMEECYKLGLAKSIGVSNFSCKKLSQILSFATIPPAVNQVEMHPLWQQKKLREFCADKDIHVSAYSPLGGKGAHWGSDAIFECEELKQIAEAKGKSVAQICLRWAYEQRVSILPKSYSKERLKENTEIFDWELINEELKKISLLPQARHFSGEALVSAEYGVFNSVEDIWDGEV